MLVSWKYVQIVMIASIVVSAFAVHAGTQGGGSAERVGLPENVSLDTLQAGERPAFAPFAVLLELTKGLTRPIP